VGSRKVHNSDTELLDRNRNKPRGRQGSAVGCQILYVSKRSASINRHKVRLGKRLVKETPCNELPTRQPVEPKGRIVTTKSKTLTPMGIRLRDTKDESAGLPARAF